MTILSKLCRMKAGSDNKNEEPASRKGTNHRGGAVRAKGGGTGKTDIVRETRLIDLADTVTVPADDNPCSYEEGHESQLIHSAQLARSRFGGT
jgi:hypothetical protein